MSTGDALTPQYEKAVKSQADAERRRGQRPNDRKRRDAAIEAYNQNVMNSGMEILSIKMKGSNTPIPSLMRATFIPPAYLPSTAPLASLSPITIPELQLEMPHRGKYIALRGISSPIRPPATDFIVDSLVEDSAGEAALLTLHFQLDQDQVAVTDVMPKESMVIVKEPLFQPVGKGMYTIRVYHLSDLVHIEEDSELLPGAWRRKSEETANQLKLKGNEAVKQRKWWIAINEYSRALRQNPTEEEKVIIRRNRALAFIRTGQFAAALEDTGFPDFGELPNDKALYRAGEALYTLQRFKECADVVGLLRSKFPDNRDAKPLEEKVKIRIKEQDTGVYDFAGMQKQAARTTPPLLDHATYIGPMEVKNTKKKGRGMFTTRPVKAGELLLCEKAFAYVWVDSNGSNAHPLMNLALKNLQFGGHLMLIRNILQKLYHTPSKVESIGKLHNGTYKPADNISVDGKPVVDTFLVERIVDLNGFGFERRSLDTLNRSRYHTSVEPTKTPPLGLWATAAYMNHSCVSSAHRACIGNMIIIRAEHDLPAGAELTLQYMSPGQGAEPGSIGHSWGFECNCAYCDDYKSTPARKLEQRKALREMYNQTMGARQINFPKVKQCLRQFVDTFSKPVDQVPRYELLELYWGLMAAAADRGEWALCLSAVGELLRAIGYQVEGFGDKKGEKVRVLKFGMGCAYAVEGLMLAREALKKLGRAGEIDDVMSLAKTTYKITLGEDETFHESYKDLMEGRKEWGY